jgi:N-acetylglucosaminyldiphosphoundecaprenol N-acetyl-beta-D-mannosaminyltransferase
MGLKKIEKISIGNIGISNFDLQETIDHMNKVILSEGKIRVCVTPVNCVLWARDNIELANIYNTADLTLCDGVPLLWAAKYLGTPLKGRVTGLDLLPEYAKQAANKNIKMFFLGAKEGVAEALKKQLELQYPTIKICPVYSPPFAEKFSDEENTKMISLINEHKPNILWVSLTAPKQDYWIHEHFDKLDINIAIGVGGAFEVTAGLIKRAPVWMQKAGLEWFYRFIKEPKRMFSRYFIEAPKFVPLVIKQKYFSKGR